MKDFFNQLKAEESLSNQTKFEMTSEYVKIYSEKMATATQSSDELKEHIATLEMIKAENEYYKNLL